MHRISRGVLITPETTPLNYFCCLVLSGGYFPAWFSCVVVGYYRAWFLVCRGLRCSREPHELREHVSFLVRSLSYG